MSVATLTKVFGLSPAQESKVRSLDSKRIASISKSAESLKAEPALLAQLKAALLSDLETIASAPAIPAAPVAPVAPAAPVRAIQWVLPTGASQGVPYSGSLAGVSHVWYVDGNSWEIVSGAPVAPATERQTVATIDPATIPVSPSGKGKLPWAVAVNYSAKHQRHYVTFGIESYGPINKSLYKCSVPADELLATLERSSEVATAIRSAMARLA